LEHIMKIGQFDTNLTNATAAKTERKPGPADNVGGVEPSAKVQLSSVSTLKAEGADEASFDAAKVERIANAIREGRFEVNAGAIADKLIANAQELLGRSSR
jgi:negative regulator of flagellin synthesis FlgM